MSLASPESQQIPSALYSVKEREKLYFNITRLTAHNRRAWGEFAGENDYERSHTGALAFYPALPYHSHPHTEVWIAFISNKPATNPDIVDKRSTEMFMTVTTSEHSPFTSHIGITRALTFPKSLQHSNVSMKLHAFAAQFMLKQHPEKHYMINAPAEIMRVIMIAEFEKYGHSDKIFIGDNRTIVEPSWTVASITKTLRVPADDGTEWAKYQRDLLNMSLVKQRDMVISGAKTISPVTIDPKHNVTITHPDGETKTIITSDQQNGEFAWFFKHPWHIQKTGPDTPLQLVTCDLKTLVEIGGLHGEIQLVGAEMEDLAA